MNKLLIVAVALAVSSAAFASPSTKTSTSSVSPMTNGWYMGVSINHNAIINKDSGNRRWGYGLFLGQRINHWLGHELSLSRLGNVVTTLLGINYEYTDIYHTAYSAYGFLPLVNNFELFAKAGISYVSMSTAIPVNHHMSRFKYSRLALNYGLGVQYSYQQFGARIAYTHINANDDADMPSAVRDIASVDAFYRFG